MNPDDLALIQQLIAMGLQPEEAIALLSDPSLGQVLGQMQQGVAGNYAAPPAPIPFTPPQGPPPQSALSMADAVYEDGSNLMAGPPGLSDTGWQFPGGGPEFMPPSSPFAGTSMMGTSGFNPTGPFQGTGVPGDNRPPDDPFGRGNRMSNKPEAAAAIRDQANDLGAVIRTLMGLGRAGVAQNPRNPPRPAPPTTRGRSAQAPGQMKQAAGVQSARSFTPAATRAQNPPRPATPAPAPAPAPRPSVPKPAPTPRPPATRAPVPKPATTITRAKSR
jgi:hypothetical protein